MRNWKDLTNNDDASADDARRARPGAAGVPTWAYRVEVFLDYDPVGAPPAGARSPAIVTTTARAGVADPPALAWLARTTRHPARRSTDEGWLPGVL